MIKHLTLMAALTLSTLGGAAATRQNPLMQPFTTPYQIPPFEQIQYSDYMPALEKGLEISRNEVEAIANNKAKPTFDNTILALEKSGWLANRTISLLASLQQANTSPEFDSIADIALPMYSAAQDEMMMNDKLFKRVKTLYDTRNSLGLDGQRVRAIENCYRDFVRNGALLDDAKKEQLKKINNRLQELYLKFGRNLLTANNAFMYVVSDPAMLAGLPQTSIDLAAQDARAAGKDGSWVFTLKAPSRLPVLQFADNRDLRRAIYEGYTNLASSGATDNKPVIAEILKTRAAKAKLLGYPDYAAYMTANVMAKTPENAENLLMQIWKPAIARVDREVNEMQTLANLRGDNITIEPWDYYYYAEQLRKSKYNLNEDEVKGYFNVDSVANGIFKMAEKLYGVKFTPMPDAPKYHPDVKVYDVTDNDGNHVAVFMTDYYARPSKRQGAWMDAMQGSFVDPDGTVQRPIVYNVCNFAPPTPGTPSLLSMDDVETMFHEFGHGLHGMLSRAPLRSQSGTNVDRDFVELPSQIHEHWAFEPELLRQYARHYKTGEVIPDSLIAKIEASSTHNQGFTTTELAGAALLDLAWGKYNPADGEDIDVAAFERKVASDLGMPKEVQFRYRSTYFNHIFGSDGYASGYYTYLWAEVLDADGFELFKEKGIFDPATAKLFKETVLESGGSVDPMALYVKFRGHEPSVKALLRNRGLDDIDTDTPRKQELNTPGGK